MVIRFVLNSFKTKTKTKTKTSKNDFKQHFLRNLSKCHGDALSRTKDVEVEIISNDDTENGSGSGVQEQNENEIIGNFSVPSIDDTEPEEKKKFFRQAFAMMCLEFLIIAGGVVGFSFSIQGKQILELSSYVLVGCAGLWFISLLLTFFFLKRIRSSCVKSLVWMWLCMTTAAFLGALGATFNQAEPIITCCIASVLNFLIIMLIAQCCLGEYYSIIRSPLCLWIPVLLVPSLFVGLYFFSKNLIAKYRRRHCLLDFLAFARLNHRLECYESFYFMF